MSLAFTYQTQLEPGGIPGNTFESIAVSPSGTTLVASVDTGTGDYYFFRSTDGGNTWNTPASSGIFSAGYISLLWVSGTTWICTAYPGLGVWYSTDDGITWARTSTGTISVQSSSGATDGAGTSIFLGVTSAILEWNVGNPSGTWNNGATPSGWNNPANYGCLIWDGTQFVALATDSPSLNYTLYTAPSGFIQSAGPVWTVADTAATSACGTAVGDYSNLCYLPGVGYAVPFHGSAGSPSAGIRVSATLAGLLTAAIVDPLTVTSNAYAGGVWALNDIFLTGVNGLAFGTTVNIADSTDGVSWDIDATNFPQNDGGHAETLALAAYDATNNSYIIVGGLGSVSTSAGLAPPTVPAITGETVPIATVQILTDGFTVGVISYQSNPTIPAGNIIAQSPAPGSIATPGTAINLAVSTGPAPPFAGPNIVPPFDIDATVISQYANSPTLIALVENFGQYFDPTANLNQFYYDVWDIDHAFGFGLDIWGIILGVSRIVPIPGTQDYFGFDNSDMPPDWVPFGSTSNPAAGAPFYAGATDTGSYTLNDAAYRTLLLTKALANICTTTAPALNALVSNLFPGDGVCYTEDLGGMQMKYVFDFVLTPIQFAILAYSGVLPHPAGVSFSVQQP
jgi:hypothetical protein